MIAILTPRLLVALAALVACASAVSAASTVHTVITTECGEYFSWQSLGEALQPEFSCSIGAVQKPGCRGGSRPSALRRCDENRQIALVAPPHPSPPAPAAAGMLYSHRKSGQPGPLTRIMCCTPQEWEDLSEEAKVLMPTHVAPSFTKHPRTGDE